MAKNAPRSYLFAPGGNQRILDKVFTAGADAVVLDLEDAVAPAAKAAARETLRTNLESLSPTGQPPIWVRINPVGSGMWRDDLAAAVGPWLSGIRIPKAQDPDAIEKVADFLALREAAAGMETGSVALTLTVESALGVRNCHELAQCDRVTNLCFGNVDFLADIGARDAEDGLAAIYAHSRVVLASRVAGIRPPIAPVLTRLDDVDALRASTERFRSLGFFGRSCIHPKQLPIIHEVFTPTADDVAEAQEIVAAYERGLEDDSGSEVTKSGQFVDIAVVKRAQAVITLAEELGGCTA
ncbi:MAG: CoA ester lyase [bacterium]|nr:CoA ester lyase [bacterium]